jgi:outer membrane protein OmpA-like peptidoglycan-associated protein
MLLGAWWMSTNRADCLGGDKAFIEETVITESPPTTLPTVSDDAFIINDGSFRATAAQGIQFALSDDTPIIGAPANTALNELAIYLATNAERQLTLLGEYQSDEQNNTNFLNLGLARAGAVKIQLINMGAVADRIALRGMQVDDSEVRNDTLLNSIGFRFSAMETLDSDEDITNLRSTILAEPAIIYFATASANVNLDEAFQVKIQNLKTYLRAVDDATVTVSGHTDNVGNVASNTALSERRAAQIKEYLVGQGFAADRISVVGRGPSVPMADNSTPEGRAKNRRVEIQLDE